PSPATPSCRLSRRRRHQAGGRCAESSRVRSRTGARHGLSTPRPASAPMHETTAEEASSVIMLYFVIHAGSLGHTKAHRSKAGPTCRTLGAGGSNPVRPIEGSHSRHGSCRVGFFVFGAIHVNHRTWNSRRHRHGP